MNKYKIKVADNKYYVVYSESHENAVKKLRDAQAKRISDDIQSKIDAITNIVGKVMYGAFPRDHGGTFSYRVYPNEVGRTIALIKRAFPGIEIKKWSSNEIEIFKRSLNDSNISDYQPKEISHSRLEAIPLQARQELQNSKNKRATLLSIEGNIEDIINAADPEIKGDLQRIGSKILNDLRKQFNITDTEIKDCEIEDKLIQSGSEEAFKKNIATEIRAGKDPKQAAAIAYSVQRENDNTIKDSIAKVENIGKFTLWQDEDTKEYYFDATISRSGKKLHPLGTKDINKAREKVKKELEWITDSAIEDSYYTESEKKDKQFVKNAIEEMEGYINNWNFLTARQKRDIGSSREQLKARVAELKQVKDSSIKDSSDYAINYRNSYTGERNKETIKANSAIDAIKEFADAVALRGWGTRNIDIISISPNDGHMRLYGSLQALLASREFRDCNTVVNDSEPKNWTYVMFGTTGEKKVENLTKAEAEHLLKNNKLLGYDGKIFETNLVRDAITYGITPAFKWNKGNRKPERVAKTYDDAVYIKNSLERADGISYVIFEIETNKKVY